MIAEWYDVDLSKGKFVDNNTKMQFGEIFDMGGKDAFEDESKTSILNPIIETLQFEDIPMLIIFDADIHSVSKPIIEEICTKRNFHYFLLPYNGTHPEPNRNDGDLETLLQEIICGR